MTDSCSKRQPMNHKHSQNDAVVNTHPSTDSSLCVIMDELNP